MGEQFSVDIRSVSICAGAGGLDLGVELALGVTRPILYVEREVGAAQIMAARIKDGTLPPAHIWSDIATFDARQLQGKVDLVYGGIPCQPWSVAGKRLGHEDERWIWDDAWRIIRDCEEECVLLENVPGFIRGGLQRVLNDFAQGGFDAEWCHLSAADVGAPHKRERVFILAYRSRRGLRVLRESCRRAGFIERSEKAMAEAADKRR